MQESTHHPKSVCEGTGHQSWGDDVAGKPYTLQAISFILVTL